MLNTCVLVLSRSTADNDWRHNNCHNTTIAVHRTKYCMSAWSTELSITSSFLLYSSFPLCEGWLFSYWQFNSCSVCAAALRTAVTCTLRRYFIPFSFSLLSDTKFSLFWAFLAFFMCYTYFTFLFLCCSSFVKWTYLIGAYSLICLTSIQKKKEEKKKILS